MKGSRILERLSNGSRTTERIPMVMCARDEIALCKRVLMLELSPSARIRILEWIDIQERKLRGGHINIVRGKGQRRGRRRGAPRA